MYIRACSKLWCMVVWVGTYLYRVYTCLLTSTVDIFFYLELLGLHSFLAFYRILYSLSSLPSLLPASLHPLCCSPFHRLSCYIEALCVLHYITGIPLECSSPLRDLIVHSHFIYTCSHPLFWHTLTNYIEVYIHGHSHIAAHSFVCILHLWALSSIRLGRQWSREKKEKEQKKRKGRKWNSRKNNNRLK